MKRAPRGESRGRAGEKRRRYITLAQLADALDVGKTTVRRWIEAEKLPPPLRTEGGHMRWKIAVAKREVERRGHDAPEEWAS